MREGREGGKKGEREKRMESGRREGREGREGGKKKREREVRNERGERGMNEGREGVGGEAIDICGYSLHRQKMTKIFQKSHSLHRYLIDVDCSRHISVQKVTSTKQECQ